MLDLRAAGPVGQKLHAFLQLVAHESPTSFHALLSGSLTMLDPDTLAIVPEPDMDMTLKRPEVFAWLAALARQVGAELEP